jgi:hypothetical protein
MVEIRENKIVPLYVKAASNIVVQINGKGSNVL